MVSDLIIYEPVEYGDKEDFTRFEESAKKLANMGITIDRIKCSDVSDVPSCCEAFELVKEKGLAVLPITDYMGVVVFSEKYPDDQTLADYLDVPDGVLSANKKGAPSLNDLPPACSCGNKGETYYR
jgi:hypothetical protein